MAFEGTERFELRSVLGAGGFGRVFEAYDRATGTVVALKTLQRVSPDEIARFKSEFRSLADFVHPNVVALYELLSADELWFFTMELVRGEPLLAHVGTTPRPSEPSPTWEWSRSELPHPVPPEKTPEPVERSFGPTDQGRLRDTFRQIAEGVAALHAAGMLHRDLKPSNVRVTRAGRAVLLDFGLVASLRTGEEAEIAGTPGYMAPEQATGGALGPAADWYAFGATLFEALCGRPPFEGAPGRVLWSQQHTVAPDPRSFAPDVPDDLADLALGLLDRDPERRPAGDQVLGVLGGERAPRWRRASFVGRVAERRALADAFAAVRPGRPVLACLIGDPGIGKSALVRQFVDDVIARSASARVFEGRCYERESVPFKALDDLVDRIGRHVRSLPPEARGRLEDRLIDLARLFPSLGEARSTDTAEAREVRRRAAFALRSLLRALADEAPLVLVIDDLQWGDVDSAELLEAVLAPPDAPGLLLVGTCRREGVGAPLPRALLCLGDDVTIAEVRLEALSPSDTQHLASLLVGDREHAIQLARASEGNPFVLQGLVRDASGIYRLGLLEAMVARAGGIPAEDREILQAIVAAGRPVRRDRVRAASGVDDDAAPLARLRLGQLVKATGTPGNETLEPWHDRVREGISATMGPARARVHARWAEVLADADPEWLLLHHREAGQRDPAARCAVLAADRAAATLAFHHAVDLYREAIALGTTEDVHARLADALVSCGRSPEAAEAWLVAAQKTTGTTALQHRRRAAEQLLLSGHARRGRAVADEVLTPLGFRMPRWSWGAALSLLWNRAWLSLGGLRFAAGATADPALLLRIDTCWSIASAMGMVDTLRAYDFQARQARLALGSGDPWRATRALALEAAYLAVSGPSVAARCEAILEQARALAAPLDEPHAHAIVALADGIVRYLTGDLAVAVDRLGAAERELRTRCHDVNWELSAAVSMAMDSRMRMGAWTELSRSLPAIVAEARHSGNRYVHGFSVFVRATSLLLADDRPEQAMEEIRAFYPDPAWSQPTIQDWWGHHGPVPALLYRGEAGQALERLDAHWTAIALAGLPMVRLLAATMYVTRAAAVLGVARERTGWRRRRLLWRAARLARSLRGLDAPWAAAMADLADGNRAAARGEDERAIRHLAAAEVGLEGTGQRVLANVAAYRRGTLIGGDAGATVSAAAADRLAKEGVRRPERLAEVYAPAPR